MLRVLGASEEELANVPVEEASDVKSLKQYLQRQEGISVFRQELVRDGVTLEDEDKLNETSDLQLILHSFAKASAEEAQKLSAAASSGSIFEVEEMLQSLQDPDSADKSGKRPLIMASMGGHETVARLLLEAGADKDLPDDMGVTPLIGASCEGHVETVRLLLEALGN